MSSADAAMSEAPAASSAAAAAASPVPAAAAAGAAPAASVAAPAAAPAPAAAKGGKGKGKGKKDEVAEVDPQYEGQRFAIGELIYANYAEGKQWFDAKVLKVEKRQGKIFYYLHYNGWGDKYQDWRPYHNDDELHKHDEEGRRIADEAKARMRDSKKKPGGVAAASTPADSKGKGGKKRRQNDDDDPSLEEVEVGGGAGEVRLRISGNLKRQLIHDWEHVTRAHSLVTLPRPLSVRALLSEFEKSKEKQESAHAMIKEVVAGIEQYFEKALGTILLYRFERPQYKQQLEQLKDGKTLADIYGAEHLLRLFVKLPNLLSHSKLDPREAIVLGSKLNDFLKWLDKKAQGGQVFQQEYEAVEKDYIQAANDTESSAV